MKCRQSQKEILFMNLFNLDNPVMQFLSKLADLFILNLLFLICCIPIVTIGPASVALYTVTLKAAKNEESYIVKSFFKAFKSNFKIGILTWLIALAAGMILWVDFRILPNLSGQFRQILQVLIMMITLLYLITVLYLFPYIARFENSVTGSIKNAFLMAVVNLPYTMLLAAITVLAILATLYINFSITGFVWLVIGFSGLAYINSIFFRKIFAKFE